MPQPSLPTESSKIASFARFLFIAALVLLLSACAPAAPQSTPVQALSITETPSPRATLPNTPVPASPTPEPTHTPSATAAPSPTSTSAIALCSPLEGIALSEIGQPDLLKNLFQAPKPGMDDGHFGADFSYWSRGEHTRMLGLPIYAALPGKVVGLILNRIPYGNAIIIETPLDALPTAWQTPLQVPTPAPTVSAILSLSCPPDTRSYSGGQRSLYLLYAHLNQPPLATIGQTVTCGQAIGEVGTTGNSVNPHLHLETRVGPADALFDTMAHYDNASTEDERRNYCTWRVSGLFQAFDPLRLLSLK